MRYSQHITISSLFVMQALCIGHVQYSQAANRRASKSAAPKPANLPDFGSGLLDVGSAAPGFTLPTPSGGKISLAEALRGKKALILDFWFVGCRPCREEMPHLQALYRQLGHHGLGILAVDNRGEPAKAITTFMRKNRYTFQVAQDPDRMPDIAQDSKTWTTTLSGRYHAGGAPITYIITPDGKVAWRETGFFRDHSSEGSTEGKLKKALAELGVNSI